MGQRTVLKGDFKVARELVSLRFIDGEFQRLALSKALLSFVTKCDHMGKLRWKISVVGRAKIRPKVLNMLRPFTSNVNFRKL